jgi:hypothetical protein
MRLYSNCILSTPFQRLYPMQIRAWARGRDALLSFGSAYWLRLSLITAVVAASVAVLLAVLLAELAVRVLDGSSALGMDGVTAISPVTLILVAAYVTSFMAAFARLVVVAVSIADARAQLRTSLLRLAVQWESADAGVSGAVRGVADVISSEEAHSDRVCMLGVPLEAAVLQKMASSLVFVLIGFYQEAQRMQRAKRS